MKILLPVEKDPLVKNTPMFSQPLSIIYASCKNCDAFVINNFLQLFVEKLTIAPDKPIVSFYLPNNALLDLFNNKTVSRDKTSKETILQEVIEELRNRKYVYTSLNEFYIKGTGYYQRFDMYHFELIYGFDDERKVLFALCYDENEKFDTVAINYDDFILAYENATNAPYAYITYELKKKLHFKPDAILYKKLLKDYINSSDSFNKSESDTCVYGYNIYDYLLQNLTIFREGDVDPRDFATLYEHKVVIQKLIKNYIKSDILAKEYDRIVMIAWGLRTRVYQYNKAKNEKILNVIKHSIIQLQQEEKDILLRVLDCIKISKWKEFTSRFKKTKSKNCNSRPFTLESKMRDIIMDEEAMSIVEEYLPNIRQSSTVTLLYGMAIKHFVGMGRKVGLSEEQEKELLERILMLK